MLELSHISSSCSYLNWGFVVTTVDRKLVLKLITASIYANFTTTIIDDEGIEQADSYIAGPVGRKLVLKFHEIIPQVRPALKTQ